MRIAIDARAYFQRTGIARYTRGLVHALAEAATGDEFLLLISDHHRPQEIAAPPHVTVAVSRASWLGGAQEREVLQTEARDWRADVFHAIFPPLALDDVRSVVTLFDVTPLTRPEAHRDIVRQAFTDAWAHLMQATHAEVVAVSHATRRAAQTHGVVATHVIGIGLSAPFDGPAPPMDSARRGVLCVGTLEPRKNVTLLLDAAAILEARGCPVPMRIVGGIGWGDLPDASRTPLASVAWCGYLSDSALLDAYRHAAVLASPSREEGFGLPVLEAMAQGTLPLVSHAEALVELVGDPRLVVNHDAGAWADALAWWSAHDEARVDAVQPLTARARQTTWHGVARAWLAVYRGRHEDSAPA